MKNSNTHHRRLALHCQGLDKKRPFARGLAATLRAIEHLGYVQIDTIAVVERAHHHVLWTRNPDYQPAHLNQLLAQGKIFEHWAHAAAYLPMRDYRFATVRMQRIRASGHPWYADIDKHLAENLLAQIRERGASRLRDLERADTGKSGNWWDWQPARRALDKLFLQGDLMICARDGMEKIYDLTERVLPRDVDTRTPDTDEYAAYLLDGTLRAHGIVSAAQVLHLQSDKAVKKAVERLLRERMANGDLIAAPGLCGYWMPRDAGETPAAPRRAHILSPFDNLVIHRQRLAQLFAFDYRLECYLPAAKRQYGYFALPVLCGERFVARLDCKAHRREQRLQVLQCHVENDAPPLESLTKPVAAALAAFARFNQCATIDLPADGGWLQAGLAALKVDS
ncbi:MAG: crosslink repair DNA glycosylase YcaQ family protein [Cardiobacteriaceae bacterium]|nr:crosslink repair DNA glycosylase YcaQ family protein [Cardiobacteriaceae bacterium]